MLNMLLDLLFGLLSTLGLFRSLALLGLIFLAPRIVSFLEGATSQLPGGFAVPVVVLALIRLIRQ